MFQTTNQYCWICWVYRMRIYVMETWDSNIGAAGRVQKTFHGSEHWETTPILWFKHGDPPQKVQLNIQLIIMEYDDQSIDFSCGNFPEWKLPLGTIIILLRSKGGFEIEFPSLVLHPQLIISSFYHLLPKKWGVRKNLLMLEKPGILRYSWYRSTMI